MDMKPGVNDGGISHRSMAAESPHTDATTVQGITDASKISLQLNGTLLLQMRKMPSSSMMPSFGCRRQESSNSMTPPFSDALSTTDAHPHTISRTISQMHSRG